MSGLLCPHWVIDPFNGLLGRALGKIQPLQESALHAHFLSVPALRC